MTTQQERFIREEEFLRLFKKARKELDDGNLKSAIEYLEKAYQLSPDSEGVENLLGILYFRIKDFRKAEEIYQKLTRKNPDVFTLRTNLGLIYFKEKRYFDAIRELDKAVRIKQDYPRAHNYLGLVYVELGKYRQAREEFLRAGSRVMAKKIENIISGSMSPDAIQNTYREKEKLPADHQDVPIAQFILDPDLKKILDDFEEAGTIRSGSEETPTNVEHIRLDHGRDGLIEASTPKKPIFSETKTKAIDEKEHQSTFKLGMTKRDAGYGAHNLLTIYFMGGTYSRLGGLIAAEGKYGFSPAKKRHKGKFIDKHLGGTTDPLMKISGEGTLLLSAGDKRIQIMTIMPNENLYIKESCLFAFESTISWENGAMSIAPKENIELVQISGKGGIAMISTNPPVIQDVSEDKPLTINKESLVGWIGKVTPRISTAPGTGDDQKDARFFIDFTGKGKVIIE